MASVGFEPANLGTKGQHATPRPPKLLLSCLNLISDKLSLFRHGHTPRHETEAPRIFRRHTKVERFSALLIGCLFPQEIFLIAIYTVSEKDCTLFFYFFFLGAQCVESGVSCSDCY